MNAHNAEIRPETRLEKTARGRIERLPGRMQHCIDGWRSDLSQFARADTFGLNVLFALACGACSATGADTLQLRFRHPHHLIGYLTRFLLVGIVGLADGKLGLDQSRIEQSLDGEISSGLLHPR